VFSGVAVVCSITAAQSLTHLAAAAAAAAAQDFANMSNEEVRQNINSRRDKIFLLMEELRRLRIQQRLKVCGGGG
jgi:hypothetical protein